jgi:cytochrome b6-f complex iron-sulfur subunit
MSSTTIIAIAIGVVVVLGALLFVVTSRRSDSRRGAGALSRETVRKDRSEADLVSVTAPVSGREVEAAAAAERSAALVPVTAAPPPAPYVPPDPEQLGVTRRQFFNRSAVTLMLVGIGAFGAAVVAFLWPKLSGGFGSKITIGKYPEVVAAIQAGKNFLYVPEGRAWVTQYPPGSVPKAEASGAYAGPVLQGMQEGLVALYQKCPHLGCRVPQCDSSQWFECGCHGSMYNRVGEKKAGPAPRGMDHFPIAVSGGLVTIDTAQVFPGAPIGTNTTGQEAEGPHCVSAGGGH